MDGARESKSISELISPLKSTVAVRCRNELDAVISILVAREEQQKQIIEALKKENDTLRKEKKLPAASRDLGRGRTAEDIYQDLMEKNILENAMEKVEKITIETALVASIDELVRRTKEMEKEIEGFRDGVGQSQEKDCTAPNAVRKAKMVLAFDDLVFSSAARRKTTATKEDEAIQGEVLNIEDSDDECVVPNGNTVALENPKEGDLSVETNAEKRGEMVKRGWSSSVNLSNDNNMHKDDTAGSEKLRKIEGTCVPGDPLIRSLHDPFVLEKSQMSNAKAKEYATPLTKSSPDGLMKSAYRGNSSYSDSGMVKTDIRRASNVGRGKVWKYLTEMVTDLARNDVLCMQAVCALHRHRTSVEKSLKSTSGGTSRLDLLRKASAVAKFLTNGDTQSRLKRSVAELKNCSHHSIGECREIAFELSMELFKLYKEDASLFGS